MRTAAICAAVPLLLAVGCSSSTAHHAAPAGTTITTHGAAASSSTTTATPTTLTIAGVTAATTAGKPNPAATGKILMVKLYVGDLARGEQFYGAVFGAKFAMTVGKNAHIVTLPNGGPGLVLLQAGSSDANKKGAFIIQVPNLRASQALAVAHGATVQGQFAGAPSGQAARSVDLLDPWGNQVEILQIG
jgi:predicted enzyme related to lactoylglutathione lyase